ncbi:NADH-quinone oxidoreductase subunit L [Actinocatenispora sera]|uniref:NADH-quinone oxidoreductase subunit L n=1 Tax=Actinocatenispora sera TaxID=390989 RepID=A0A810KXC0_9ACTN|nr:NADH-quinone oxidoreductase subunit L [Actinocatenispora sera]BCJ27880.1 NADH-quinone oxidoreductase subunit L [Actinocatenispora sera]
MTEPALAEQVHTVLAAPSTTEHVSSVAASGALSSVWLLIAIPLASAVVLLLTGRKSDRWGHILGCASIGASFVLAVWYFFALRGMGHKAVSEHLGSFIQVGGYKVDWGILYDPLSATFALLITGVGFLIHVYAIGYMKEDPGRRRFFGYFNLFAAAMLLLVLGNNFLMTFIGWEGVGVASYLLISWYQDRPASATAGKKAFLMNRVGDAAFLVAMFLMFGYLGSTDFTTVFNGVGALPHGVTLAIALCLLGGACGKSGQFPLQAWLPDAMEGPTPVSALIHAATMVTAGVYLIARANPIFDATTIGSTIVVAVGAFTLLLGCIIGCAKDDIKRVLAYSTVSQIGYMFLAVGLGGGAYALGILHLLAHGFFKAGLFLGAGSVMHGMKDQTDMRRFGGLWKYMKVTWVTVGLGFLAIIGIPPLSGFFSKDPIIEAAFARGGWQGWVFGLAALLGAGLTAFYMTRLFVLTFHGKKRWTDDIEHPHESPAVMQVPMILLAVGSVAAGGLLVYGGFTDWLEPVFGTTEVPEAVHYSKALMTGISIVVVLLGVAISWLLFRRGTAETEQPARTAIVRAARENLYGDVLNETLFELPGKLLTRAAVFVDGKGVDGIVTGLAAIVGGSSSRLRRLQTGFVRSYALTILGGALVVVAALMAVKLG